MALVACQECKKQISSQAKVCPQCGAKQRRTSLLTWIVGGVFALVVVNMIISSNSRRESEAKANQAVAQQAGQKRIDEEKQKASCISRRDEMLNQFQALVQQGQFQAAGSVVSDCARLTGDAGLQQLASKARAADLRDTAEGKKYSASARLIAVEMLIREFPSEADAKTKMLQEQLRKLKANEDAAEGRKVAAEKRRQGVRIGMSKEDVLASSWGRPEKINKSTYSWGTTEQWVYGSGNYLYFKNDVLESVQN